MNTQPYVLTQVDMEFHSRILLEHAAFIHLAIEEEPYKTQAFEHYQQWQQFIAQGYPEGQVQPLVSQLRDLKTVILEQLLDGKWLGWLSVSFMRHIIEELEQFQLLIQGQRPPPDIMAVQAWRLMADHLEDAESKTDPLEVEMKQQERQLIESVPRVIRDLAHRGYTPRELMDEYSTAVQQLAGDNGQPETDLQFMIGLTLHAGEQIDQLLGRIEEQKPKTIIHPILLRHWIDEGHHHSKELAVALAELQRTGRL
jgi:hypothetical protein